MTNEEISRVFVELGVSESIERVDDPMNVRWMFQSSKFPILIQTQENVDRMRIVAFIQPTTGDKIPDLYALLRANYHSALDVRYAVTDDHFVAAFIHPLGDLSRDLFVLGLFQVINCAETFGTDYNGGTLLFGKVRKDHQSQTNPSFTNLLQQLQSKVAYYESDTKRQHVSINYNYFSGSVQNANIQQGIDGNAQIGNRSNIDLAELACVISEIHQAIPILNLSEAQLKELKAEIRTMTAQQSSPKPKVAIIKNCLGSIKRILEGTTSGVAAQLVVNITKLFGQ